MTLTVEDGTGLAAADAFVSVANCDTYCTSHGLTDWTDATSDPDADEAAIRRATAWLSTAFRWSGAKLNGRSQALAWPREDATDGEGEDIATDEVPVEIVQATCIAAAYERANPGGLSPSVTMTDRVKRERVGSLEVEYAGAAQTPESARPVLTRVMDLIGGLTSGASVSYVGRAVRG
jgi:hypothetical protein